MQCCVPFCDNTSTTEKKEVTFHGFPSDMYLRAAWLRALGKQDTHQPDPGVVCSLHFLDDDFYEAEGYVRQIRSDAVPTTVQICMMCLDTDSKLVPMSKHQLEEEYQLLTGQTLFQLCETANLQQTLCVLCAQRLIHFRTFRHMSLRARSLIMDLVQKYQFITMQHTNMIKQATKQFKCNLVSTTLGPDHCDLYIYQCDEDQKPELEDIMSVTQPVVEIEVAAVKHEVAWTVDDMEQINQYDYQTDDNMVSNEECESKTSLGIKLVKEDGEITVSSEQMAEALNSLKRESASFTCTHCSEEFEQENAYYEHVSNHLQNTDNYSGCDSIQESKPRAAVSGDEHRQGMQRLNAGPPPSTEDSTQDLVAPLSGNTVQATGGACAIQKSKQILDINTEEMNSDSSHSDTEILGNDNSKPVLNNQHISTAQKRYSCDTCSYKCVRKDHLARHKLTHTNEKPYSCEICDFRCIQKSNLTTHMITHFGDKQYSCEICDYKCTVKSYLTRHKRTHTDKKPYCCEICNYKCTSTIYLSRHRAIHSGQKPYSCEICDYKCALKHRLIDHIKSHSGKKPYSCEMCSYKCTRRSHLASHKLTHTGERPYACEICDYKCARKSDLTRHKLTHTGEKS